MNNDLRPINTIPNFKRFCMTIGELPTSYLETMTYYEMLLWFTEYMKNTIIPTINNNGLAVQELQDKYIELKNFVDNYFDNLDVQEEINNKLDEMAESGELTDIIAQYLGLAGMLMFNTVNDMKQATNLVNGSTCQTLGFYEINDGGKAIYKIRNITNQDIINEMNIIALNNQNLIAELINNKEINLTQFGCYGNGENDDTNTIKKIIQIAQETNLPITSSNDKTYLISEELTINNINIKLNNIIFKTDNTINIKASEKILELPKLQSISTLSNNIGFNIKECNNCNIKIPYINGFNIGLQLTGNEEGCAYNQLFIQEIFNCLTSIKLLATNNGWVNENIFIGGRIWCSSDFLTLYGSSIIKIYLQGSSNHVINNNYFLKQSVEGQEGVDGGLKIKLDYARSNVFESLRYEGNNGKIDITNSSNNLLSNGVSLHNIEFTNSETTRMVNGVNNIITNGGALGGVYMDILPSSSASTPLQVRNPSNKNIANKITYQGFITCDNNGNESIRMNNSGIQAMRDNTYKYMMRNYGKWTLLPNCDFTNGGLVLNSGDNVTGGVFLWLHDGHLYGKVGTPSTALDGTIIL